MCVRICLVRCSAPLLRSRKRGWYPLRAGSGSTPSGLSRLFLLNNYFCNGFLNMPPSVNDRGYLQCINHFFGRCCIVSKYVLNIYNKMSVLNKIILT
jgi:hypothetical protein